MARDRKFDTQAEPLADAQPGLLSEKRFELFAIAVLLVFGIYQSIQLFGYTSVPNSDFPPFVNVARKILSLDLPSNFKRLPGLGLLQIGLSKFTTGQHPVLTAGWLLNSILHPASLVLLYLIAKKIISKTAAFWLAIIIALNPQMANMITQPMAETTLMFFILLTLYLVIVRSKFCYVVACAATVIRYDAAVLIIAAMAADVFENRSKRNMLITMIKGSLAFLPLGLWVIATKLNWESSSTGHYFGHYTSTDHIGFEYLNLLWNTAMGSLLQLPAWIKAIFVQRPSPDVLKSLQQTNELLFGVSKFFAAAGLIVAAIHAIVKKNTKLLPLFVFLVCNLAVQMMRMISTPRYCYVLVPIVILLCCYGWQIILKFINRKMPSAMSAILCGIAIIISVAWAFRFVPALDGVARISPVSGSLLTAGLVAIIVFAIGSLLLSKGKGALRIITMTALMSLMLMSNHFILSQAVGDGKKDAEFRMLAEWFAENAQPGEKLATSLPGVVKIFLPSRKKDVVHISYVGGEDANQFVADCYKKKVKYIAWDSRVGLSPGYSYYKAWRIDRIAFLREPRNIGPYEFVAQQVQSNRRYINIFRLKPPPK